MDTFDDQFINNQFKDKTMEPVNTVPQEESWTSVDAYYKGFHIKKSWGKNVNRVILMAEIDDLIKAGFTPSWNQDTNKAMSAPVVAPTAQNVPSVSDRPQTQYVELTPDQTITKYGLTDMVALQLKTPCKRCGSAQAYNPKTGKVFCKARCWTK